MRGAPPWPRITLIASIGAAVVMALYVTLYWDSNPPPSLLSGQRDLDRIDLYAELIRGVKYDANGRPVQLMWAAKMEHYPERGQSVLQNPALQSLGKDGELWNTTATTGVLIGDSEIQLRDNVVIADSQKTTRFETEILAYFPDRQEITTAAAVKISRFDDTTTAIGMRANLATNRVELLEKVNSIHVQP